MAAQWFITVTALFFLPLFAESRSDSNKLMLLVIDGLPWEKVNDERIFPNLVQLKKEGTSVEYLKPVFPAVGYPNYFSLLTGLYPEEHGIVDEFMYDYRNSKTFFVKGNSYGGNNSDVQWFRNGELFWTTAHGQGRRVAVYGWPSCNHSDAAVGPKPDYCYEERREQTALKESYELADQALAQMEEGGVDTALMFVNKLDYVGRSPGVHSKEFNSTMAAVDKLIGYIRDRMDNSTLSATTNTVVLSTHGLSSLTRPPLVVDISRFSEDVKTAVTFFPGGSRVAIYPEEGTLVRTFNNLYRRHKHVNVYWKWNMPLKWRIRNGRFTAPIWVVADPGWAVAASKKEALYLAVSRGGLDGYDPDKSTDMRGVFVAMGPSFKQNYTHAPINITDVYNLLCHIMDVHPSNNSGQWANIVDMLETTLPHGDRRNFTSATETSSTASSAPATANTTENLTTSREPPSTANNTIMPLESDGGMGLFNVTREGQQMPTTNISREIMLILTNRSVEDEALMANHTSDSETASNETQSMEARGSGLDLVSMTNRSVDGGDQSVQGHPANSAAGNETVTVHQTNETVSNGTSDTQGSGFGDEMMIGGSGSSRLDATDLPEVQASGEGSGEEEGQAHSRNDTKRRRRSDDVRIIESVDQAETVEVVNRTSAVAKTWCECTGTMCTTRLSTLCENEPTAKELKSERASGSKVLQSTPGISVGTEEDKLADDMRADVEVHDWRDALANFTGRTRQRRTANRLKAKTEILEEEEEIGSGANFVESSSANTQTSHGNRSDLSVRFSHRAQNAQQTSNTNTANVRSQRYDLDGGFLVQNRYNLRLVPDSDDLPSSADRFLETLKSTLPQSASSNSVNRANAGLASNDDPSQAAKIPENDPLRLNQFNVANGGQATQFIIQQPVLNLLIPQQASDPQTTRARQRHAPFYKTSNSKPRIEILNYDTEDNL